MQVSKCIVLVISKPIKCEHFQVGVLMHETEFSFSETQQVVRERQQLELYTSGEFQVQRLQVVIDQAEISESEPPTFLVEWGGREASLSLHQLGELQIGTVYVQEGSSSTTIVQSH